MRLSHPEDYYIRVLFKKTKIQEVMTSPAVSVRAHEPFQKVVALMEEKHIRHMPIVNDQGQLIGLLTQRDVYKIQSPRKLEDGHWYYDKEDLARVKLSEVMIKNPFRLRPDNTFAEAVTGMAKGKYGCIPIVDNNDRLCGILTQFDFIKIAEQILQE